MLCPEFKCQFTQKKALRHHSCIYIIIAPCETGYKEARVNSFKTYFPLHQGNFNEIMCINYF